MDGLTQVQVAAEGGLTFAAGLRAIVRADPDVIMVGEIRDRETAQIAVESALTGHLVLSTLHTNDAPSAITRLIEMGIEPFLVASALDCVVAQRLARMLCPNCKRRTIIPAKVLQRERLQGARRARGLRAGRLPALRRQRLPRPRRALRGDEDEPRDPDDGARTPARGGDPRRRRQQGMTRLRDDGLEKVRAGAHLDRRDHPRDRQQLSARRRSAARSAPTRSAALERSSSASRRCAWGRVRVDGPTMDIDFADLLMEVVNRRASDLHLSSGAHPTVRVRGRLHAARGLPEAVLRRHARDRLLDPHRRPAPAPGDRTGSSTSPTRSPATPASVSTPTTSAARSAPPSA